jgi:hypothetical protein
VCQEPHTVHAVGEDDKSLCDLGVAVTDDQYAASAERVNRSVIGTA